MKFLFCYCKKDSVTREKVHQKAENICHFGGKNLSDMTAVPYISYENRENLKFQGTQSIKKSKIRHAYRSRHWHSWSFWLGRHRNCICVENLHVKPHLKLFFQFSTHLKIKISKIHDFRNIWWNMYCRGR